MPDFELSAPGSIENHGDGTATVTLTFAKVPLNLLPTLMNSLKKYAENHDGGLDMLGVVAPTAPKAIQ
jgi:hypothetical protein